MKATDKKGCASGSSWPGALPLILSALLSLSLLCSCITDDTDGCDYPLRLRFSYLFNREGKDLLREEMTELKLYLYDTHTRSLVAQKSVGIDELDADGSFVWQVPAGRHTLVAWADDGERYVVENAEQGFASHFLTLPELAVALPGNVPAAEQKCVHLLGACVTDILVNGDISPVYDVDLHKFSNDVYVNVYVEGSPLPSPPRCIVSSSNGRYDAAGNVAAVAPTCYLPETLTVEPPEGYDSGTSSLFTVLGLWASDDSHLILEADGLSEPLYDASLTQLIDRLPHLDFDLDDEFRLDFFIRNDASGCLSVRIMVDDWEVITYNVTLK